MVRNLSALASTFPNAFCGDPLPLDAKLALGREAVPYWKGPRPSSQRIHSLHSVCGRYFSLSATASLYMINAINVPISQFPKSALRDFIAGALSSTLQIPILLLSAVEATIKVALSIFLALLGAVAGEENLGGFFTSRSFALLSSGIQGLEYNLIIQLVAGLFLLNGLFNGAIANCLKA